MRVVSIPDDAARVRSQQPVVRPKGKQEEQHGRAAQDARCQGSDASLHGPAEFGEKGENTAASQSLREEKGEKCYSGTQIRIFGRPV